jgi:dihydroorotate dehydrogenase electron transfer subunit
MRIDKPLILPIAKVVTENNRVKSFYFRAPLKAFPGQFVMIWVLGYDEKPFGVIVEDEETFLISVAKTGKTTEKLHQLKKGDQVGMRGPYGSYFTLSQKKSKITLIAGGYGMVPLAFLASEAVKKGFLVDILLGAKTKKELLRYSWLKNKRIKFFISTDDGSLGFKGFVTDLFINYLKKNQLDYVYIIGPEKMEKKAADICYQNKIPFQVSIERYIKCGFGICGQCCVDALGWRMCVEGPVVDYKRLKQITEFGRYKRTASGKVISI